MLTGLNCRLVGRKQSAAILDLELQPKLGLPDPANHPPLLLLKLLPLFPLLSDEQGAEQRGAGDGEDHQQEVVPAAFEEPRSRHRAPGHLALDSEHPGGAKGERNSFHFQQFSGFCHSLDHDHTHSFSFTEKEIPWLTRPLLIGDLGMPPMPTSGHFHLIFI